MANLYQTDSPVDREQRMNLNGTWEDILKRFANLQRQINILAGGEEVDELLQRLNDAVDKATVAVEQAIEDNNTATQEAIEVNNKALQTAIEEVSDAISQLDSAIASANDAADNANEAKKGTLEATAQAQTAISAMQSLIKNTGPKGTWDDKTQYYKNNLAEVDGRTYIALKENINTPVTDKSTWALFADKGAQGADGPRGLPGKDGKDGTGVNIITGLDSEDELPPTGSPGDAYMIHGDLYVWQENSGTWKNVGPIQGPEGKSAYDLAVKNGFEGTMEEWIESLKGPPGPPGPEGPPGPPADLTEIYQTVDELKNEVTEHSAQIATTEKLGHIKPDGKTINVDPVTGIASIKAYDSIPKGLISMWNGSVSTFPSGWVLCDGQNGTPDLRDRFIVGTGSKYSVGAKGGADSVTLTTAEMPSHSHSSGTLTTSTTGSHEHKLPGGGFSLITDAGYGSDKAFRYAPSQAFDSYTEMAGSHSHAITGSTSHAGSGNSHENRPPYYALAFIMKL